MSEKVALITGITGQDGSYLTEFLLKKGYTVRLLMDDAPDDHIVICFTGAGYGHGHLPVWISLCVLLVFMSSRCRDTVGYCAFIEYVLGAEVGRGLASKFSLYLTCICEIWEGPSFLSRTQDIFRGLVSVKNNNI